MARGFNPRREGMAAFLPDFPQELHGVDLDGLAATGLQKLYRASARNLSIHQQIRPAPEFPHAAQA